MSTPITVVMTALPNQLAEALRIPLSIVPEDGCDEGRALSPCDDNRWQKRSADHRAGSVMPQPEDGRLRNSVKSELARNDVLCYGAVASNLVMGARAKHDHNGKPSADRGELEDEWPRRVGG
jgi:hypothetical protein